MNRFGKLIFVATSLAPCAWGFAVNLYSHGETRWALLWVVIGFALFGVCLLMVEGLKKFHQRQPLHTKKAKVADKEILTFVIAYLLPLASTVHIEFKGDILTSVYVYAIIALCVYHSNAFTFNPLLAFLGYHFYEVEDDNGMTLLFLSRRILRSSELNLAVIRIDEYIFIEAGA